MFENARPEKRRELTGTEFRKGNLPGTDLYDDGLDHKGDLVQPGSTTSEAGGIYMEDQGPNDLVRRQEDEVTDVTRHGLGISETPDQPFGDEDDEAARWLRENDPDLR